MISINMKWAHAYIPQKVWLAIKLEFGTIDVELCLRNLWKIKGNLFTTVYYRAKGCSAYLDMDIVHGFLP